MQASSGAELKQELYHTLARRIDASGVQATVLSGVTPFSGEIGRDLDLYVPRSHDQRLLHDCFSEALRSAGVRWIIQPPLYHGDVTIGVSEDLNTYLELHTIADLRWRAFRLDSWLRLRAEPKALQLPFDLRFYSFRRVLMKHSIPLLSAEDVDIPRDDREAMQVWLSDSDASSDEILGHLADTARLLALNALSDEQRRSVARGLREFHRRAMFAHPVRALSAISLVARQRIDEHRLQMTPWIRIRHRGRPDLIRTRLAERLGHIFLGVHFYDSPPNAVTRRRLRGGLNLLVVLDNESIPRNWTPDVEIQWPGGNDMDTGLEVVSNEIMRGWANCCGDGYHRDGSTPG